MLENKKLPKDWNWVKLGDTFKIVSGNTPKGLEKNSNTGDFQFYKVSDMNLTGNEIRMNTSNIKLTEEEVSKLKIKIYPKGTVIFPKRGGAILTNKKRLLSKDASFDLNVMGVLPNEKVTSNFLFYWFQKLDLAKIYDGSNVPQINNKNVAPLDFPLPPLETQQAIVSKIEELFSELDKGIEDLKTAQQQLKIYRQSVLKWAFEGKLTNTKVKKGELPKGWKIVKVGDISLKVTDGEHATPKRTESGIYLLSARNIQNGYLALSNVDYIPQDEYNRIIKRCNPEEGDILISCSGSIGRICRVPKDLKFGMVRSVALVKMDWSQYDSKYFEYLFQSPILQRQIENGKKATAQANLFLGPIKNLDLIICNLEEQYQVVQEIESRLSVADKMEESIAQSLKQAEALRQSILKKAFSGELI
ncbi:type I restriction enzyme, S subunit [Flavobacterium aquidurense]|uniref:Type I restriction modification DNA specificity domain-containing protein n=1 Tax=Flavobacterium frigidimaris TaxID=262320 RepID=A0ABX4BJD0_FLAFR|nr:restriction endonuclease subunit S [Flavobacterium frigidimaris]OXA74853.1 hypothetical protein B0A65_22960 [Flavobacterium frigidimaris]SDY50003.1 type I restriction enzyme, S subunit [Flavobacterium aquidurense]